MIDAMNDLFRKMYYAKYADNFIMSFTEPRIIKK